MLAFLTLPTAGARRRAPAKRETTWVKIVIVAGLKLFSRRTSFGKEEGAVGDVEMRARERQGGCAYHSKRKSVI